MTNNIAALQFQDTIIAEITKAIGSQPIIADGLYSQKAIWPLAPLPAPDARGRAAYVAAFQVRFEDNVVAYLEMGNYAVMHGFYDDGVTATLSNTGVGPVVITAKALLGDLIS